MCFLLLLKDGYAGLQQELETEILSLQIKTLKMIVAMEGMMLSMSSPTRSYFKSYNTSINLSS